MIETSIREIEPDSPARFKNPKASCIVAWIELPAAFPSKYEACAPEASWNPFE